LHRCRCIGNRSFHKVRLFHNPHPINYFTIFLGVLSTDIYRKLYFTIISESDPLSLVLGIYNNKLNGNKI
jgi:hypothetical protein